MNKTELETASRLLTVRLLQEAQSSIPELARQFMYKFDRGPKPDSQDTAKVVLEIKITVETLFNIEAEVQALEI